MCVNCAAAYRSRLLEDEMKAHFIPVRLLLQLIETGFFVSCVYALQLGVV